MKLTTFLFALYIITMVFITSFCIYSNIAKERLANLKSELDIKSEKLELLSNKLSLLANISNADQNLSYNEISKKNISPYNNTSLLPQFYVDKSHEQYPEIKGIYIKNFKSYNRIHVTLGVGGLSIPPDLFYNGVDVLKPSLSICTNTKLILGIKDDRLYAGVELKDVNTDKTIGKLQFNHWDLYNTNELSFKSDENKFQVTDNVGNVLITIKYEMGDNNTPNIVIGGYFSGTSSVLIVTNDGNEKINYNYSCLQKSGNWKKQCADAMLHVKPIL